MARKVSNYSRKHAYLARHGLWGFEVPEPKPWRKRAEDGTASSFRSNRPCRYALEVSDKIAVILRQEAERKANGPPDYEDEVSS